MNLRKNKRGIRLTKKKISQTINFILERSKLKLKNTEEKANLCGGNTCFD